LISIDQKLSDLGEFQSSKLHRGEGTVHYPLISIIGLFLRIYSRINALLIVDIGQELALPLILLIVLLPLDKFSLYFDHFLLQELDKLCMLRILLFFLWI
jgi:hypothetical protein